MSVFAGVGERTREGNDFYHEMMEVRRRRTRTSEVQGGHGLRPDERAAGQPPARRADRPDHAESFRDEAVTCCSSSTTSTASRWPVPRCPRCWAACQSAVGYQPTLAEEMGRLQERITSTKVGSITSIQAVYVPADDLTDPSPATTFAHLGRDRRAVA